MAATLFSRNWGTARLADLFEESGQHVAEPWLESGPVAALAATLFPSLAKTRLSLGL